MLSKIDKSIAEQLKGKLLEITPLESLVVYGSRARGDSSLDSDLDVYIEVPRITPELRRDISEIAWEVGFEMDRVITTFVTTRVELEQGAMGANPLILNIEREGVRP